MTPDYYVSECDTYCADHAPEGAEPCYFSECDAPQHCAECGELLPCSLTPEGEEYVRRALAEATGSPEVLSEWARTWPRLTPRDPEDEE